jgi:hypothetical protein
MVLTLAESTRVITWNFKPLVFETDQVLIQKGVVIALSGTCILLVTSKNPFESLRDIWETRSSLSSCHSCPDAASVTFPAMLYMVVELAGRKLVRLPKQ